MYIPVLLPDKNDGDRRKKEKKGEDYIVVCLGSEERVVEVIGDEVVVLGREGGY